VHLNTRRESSMKSRHSSASIKWHTCLERCKSRS